MDAEQLLATRFGELVELGLLKAFAASGAIGLLIGLERERHPASTAGLRTFALTALFGTASALLGELGGTAWPTAIGLLLVGAMAVAAQRRDADPAGDPGTTTTIAILLCFILGTMVWHGLATIAASLAVVTTTLLYLKPELKGLSARITRRDMLSILQFGALSLVVLPALPDRGYGPHGALNPHQIWLMVVLVSGVSLAGYVALRLVGARHGLLLVGFMGGLVSSTATARLRPTRSRRCCRGRRLGGGRPAGGKRGVRARCAGLRCRRPDVAAAARAGVDGRMCTDARCGTREPAAASGRDQPRPGSRAAGREPGGVEHGCHLRRVLRAGIAAGRRTHAAPGRNRPVRRRAGLGAHRRRCPDAEQPSVVRRRQCLRGAGGGRDRAGIRRQHRLQVRDGVLDRRERARPAQRARVRGERGGAARSGRPGVHSRRHRRRSGCAPSMTSGEPAPTMSPFHHPGRRSACTSICWFRPTARSCRTTPSSGRSSSPRKPERASPRCTSCRNTSPPRSPSSRLPGKPPSPSS
ncbi:MAG: MgtC/SapB family protein [Burkholderiaceae bacterium]|nr:MgtC/SapB family protein [Burkholderiaceae bacterium]